MGGGGGGDKRLKKVIMPDSAWLSAAHIRLFSEYMLHREHLGLH